MAIKLPEKTWFTFQDLIERWQCTENDIRRLVVEESLIPSIRSARTLTTPDWKLGKFGKFEPNGRLEHADGSGRAFEHNYLNHWLYLRRPVRTAVLDCEFRLATVESDTPEPKTDYEMVGDGIFWSWLPEVMTMESVVHEAAFSLEEVARFEAKHTRKEREGVPDKPLVTKERNTLLTIIAVLCKESNLDYTTHAKTAGLIQSTAVGMGLSIGETTIENHLKKIPDALVSRMK